MKNFIVLLLAFFMGCMGTGSKGVESSSNGDIGNTDTSQQEITKFSAGDGFTVNWSNGNISFTFLEVNHNSLPDGTYNLVLKVLIKNNSVGDFWVAQSDWTLTDTSNIEIPESGVYDYSFGDFGLPLYQLTAVDAGMGKIEYVGYQVHKGVYYLYVGGKLMGQFTV